MSINREIYQCARLLIDKYGEDGAIDHCDRRIVHHVDEQDTDGVDVWKGIRAALKDFLDDAPGPDVMVH